MSGYETLVGILTAYAALNQTSKRKDFNESYFIAVDGNSLYARWIAPAINEVSKFGALVKGSGANSGNVAIPGQTWADMIKNATDIDNLYASNKKNILVIGETTNSVYNEGASVEKTVSDAKAYIAARRAAHKWEKIVLCGTIPRADKSSQTENQSLNQKLLEVDARLRADTSLYDVWVDYRAYAPQWYALAADGATAPFMAPGTCNVLSGKIDMIHPIGAARDAYADAIADGLRRSLEN